MKYHIIIVRLGNGNYNCLFIELLFVQKHCVETIVYNRACLTPHFCYLIQLTLHVG